MGLNYVKYLFIPAFMVGMFGLNAQDKPSDSSSQGLDDLTLSLYFQHPTCNGFCNGQVSIEVDGGEPPYTYSWSNGSTGPEIHDVCSGWGSVTVTDAVGNTATVDYVLDEFPAPSVIITGLIITQPTGGQNNGSISLDSIPFMDSSFYHVDSFWSIDSIHFTPYYIFPHLGPGVYYLYVREPIFGCIIRATNEIILYDITAVENLNIPYNLFPNPVSTELHLFSDVPLSVDLVDMNGKRLFSDDQKNEHFIMMAEYPEGIYFLKISDGEKIAFRKIVKTGG